MTGYFSGTVDFGGGPLTAAYDDLFVAKFTAAGLPVWSEHFGNGPSYGIDVAVKGDSDIAVSGNFMMNTLDLGGGPLTPVGGKDIFLVILEP
jgi:hypothetical protein